MFEWAEKRYAVCKQCEQFVAFSAKCRICGCFMKAKVYFPKVECPLNKWTNVSVIKAKQKETV
jgi:hypothetical protein